MGRWAIAVVSPQMTAAINTAPSHPQQRTSTHPRTHAHTHLHTHTHTYTETYREAHTRTHNPTHTFPITQPFRIHDLLGVRAKLSWPETHTLDIPGQGPSSRYGRVWFTSLPIRTRPFVLCETTNRARWHGPWLCGDELNHRQIGQQLMQLLERCHHPIKWESKQWQQNIVDFKIMFVFL